MLARNCFRVLLLSSIAMLGCLIACTTENIPAYKLKVGFYGGGNSMLYVKPKGLLLEITCADIRLDNLPKLNGENTFFAEGVYTFTPGIISEFQNISDFQQKAFLSGTLTDSNTIELTYELERDKTVKKLKLIYNRKVDVFKCP